MRSPRYFDSNDVNGYQKCKTVITYDGAGRVLSRTEAPGTPEAATESYTYDAEGRQVTRTDARGKVWTTTYVSCCGHTVASKNPLGHGSITNQNAGGLTVHTAGIADVDSHSSLLNPDDAKTLQETTTKYDALGRSIASTVWLQPLGLVDVANPPIAGFGGVAGTQGLTTQTLYDVDLTDNSGLETTTGITVTNPLGGTYTVSLAAAITKLGQPIAQGGAGITFASGTPGRAVVNINAENEISFTISDAQGRSLMSGILHPHDAVAPNTPGALLTWSCQVPDTTETVNSKVYLTSLSVDALGNTTKSRRNGLGHTVQSVDQAGNISTVQYDASGNAIVSRDPNNVGQDCVYDALGRRTQCTDTVGSVTKTGYDRTGQQISATDAKNKTTYYVFDARGRRRRETDRLNYPTEWSYDAAGNLLSLKDAENQITSYGYNDAGQRVTEQYPDHVSGATIGQAGYGIITFGYDALGRRTSKQDQQGDVTSYNFDMSGRMLTRGYVGHASGPLAGQTNTDTFTYDRAGRMLSGVKGRYNNTVTFTYDDRGQQTQETLTTHGQTYTVGYEKNILGQTTRLIYPDGSLVDRAYTNRGQLQAVNYTPLNGALSSVATFTYDAGGRETQRNLGNGLTTSRSYFADNQIQSIATPTVETLTYTYDANKNPTSESRSGVMAPYSWTTGPSGYDDEDRLTNWSRTNGDSQTWNLSPVHDWNSTTINGAVQTRTHGPAHELLTMTGAQVTNSPRTLTYDTKGNMTTDDRGCNMAWDFDNMMQSFAANGLPDLRNATYEYDAVGRCVGKSTSVGDDLMQIAYVSISHQVVLEYSSLPSEANRPTTLRCYAEGSAVPIFHVTMAASTINSFWVHDDKYESSLCLTNSSGSPVEFHTYSQSGSPTVTSPSGSMLNHDNSIPNAIVFRSWKRETESNQFVTNGFHLSPEGGFGTSRLNGVSNSPRSLLIDYILHAPMVIPTGGYMYMLQDPAVKGLTTKDVVDLCQDNINRVAKIKEQILDEPWMDPRSGSCCDHRMPGGMNPVHRRECMDRIQDLLNDTPQLKYYVDVMNNRGCGGNWGCECCDEPGWAGYWDAGKKELRMCGNYLEGHPDVFESVLTHELTHAFQTCIGAFKVDPTKGPNEGCIMSLGKEMEAYLCSGHCDSFDSCFRRAIGSSCLPNGSCRRGDMISETYFKRLKAWYDMMMNDQNGGFCKER